MVLLVVVVVRKGSSSLYSLSYQCVRCVRSGLDPRVYIILIITYCTMDAALSLSGVVYGDF